MSLKRISHLTGYSKTTVSAALLGRPDVAEKTRQEIIEMADRLGYRPNASGRALVTGRREMIGFASERGYLPGRDWTIGILGGAVDALEAHAYHVTVFHSEPRESRVPPLMLRRAVDGMILAVSWSSEFLEELLSHGMPAVIANPRQDDLPCDTVRGDDIEGARRATRHLVELGHRRIAYIGTFWPAAQSVSQVRWQGCVDVVRQAGLAICPGGHRIAATGELVTHALAHKVTAMICFNDEISVEAIRELTSRGVAVPRDVSVIGFDDLSFARALVPRLSTMRLPYPEIGRRAAEMVLERVEGLDAPPRHVLMEEELIVRESTAPPPE